jgi:hypothetical protein
MITIKRSLNLWMITDCTKKAKWSRRIHSHHPFIVLNFDRKRITSVPYATEGFFESEGAEGLASIRHLCNLINDTK